MERCHDIVKHWTVHPTRSDLTVSRTQAGLSYYGASHCSFSACRGGWEKHRGRGQDLNDVQGLDFNVRFLPLEGIHRFLGKVHNNLSPLSIAVDLFQPARQNPAKEQMIGVQLQSWRCAAAGHIDDDSLWIVLDGANNAVLHPSVTARVSPDSQLLIWQNIIIFSVGNFGHKWRVISVNSSTVPVSHRVWESWLVAQAEMWYPGSPAGT